jgi:hypothetical protein
MKGRCWLTSGELNKPNEETEDERSNFQVTFGSTAFQNLQDP